MRLRRICAYIVDMIIIFVLSSMLNSILPNHEKIANLSVDVNSYLNEYMESIENNDTKEADRVLIEINNYNYEINKLSVYGTISTIVLYFLYFIVFQSYNSGQTLGKKLLKIEVSNSDGQDVNFKQLLIRGLILYPILFNCLDVILIFSLKRNMYETISKPLVYIQYVIYLLCFALMLFTKRGLHDRLAGTTVTKVDLTANENNGTATKWQKNNEHEQSIKKYKINHTSGKRKE